MRNLALLFSCLAFVVLVIGAENRKNLTKQQPGTATASELPVHSPKTSLFHSDSNHLWNRLHEALFVRMDKDGKEHGRDAVDPLLWPGTSKFLLQDKSHQEVLALLDEFISKDGGKLIKDPLRRAVMQHDLWAIFDWTANAFNPLPFGGVIDPKKLATAELNDARKALRQRLAKVIANLALSEKEIASLPNNYVEALASKTFAEKFDKKNPARPMLPVDLFDPEGSWVCVRGALDGPSAPVHMKYYRGRSPFLVFLKLPGGREATLSYLKQLNEHSAKVLQHEGWNKNLPLFPEGTAVALVRQMTVINREGKIVSTPLVQTVQLRVYRKVGEEIKDHKTSQAAFKFTLNRRDLFGKRTGGLKPVSQDKRTGLSLVYNDDYFESGKHASASTVMQSCINCHSCGGATAKSIFSFKQDDWVPEARSMSLNKLRLLPTNIALEQKRAINWKSQRHDWGLLQGWLETQLR